MRPSRLRDALGPVGATFVLNLPLVLLGCAAYFVFFSALWGPLHPWKLGVAAALVAGLTLTVQRGSERAEVREAHQRQRPGGHAAVLRAAWPPWRRVAAVSSGVLLCVLGIYQSLGREVDLRAYPLLSGLCLIVSVGLGIILIAAGWPRAAWRRSRRAPPRGGAPTRREPAAPPGARSPARDAPTPRTGAATFKLPVPKDQGAIGWYSGVGTRPARPVWKPGRHSAPAQDDEPVPPRFRRLRLLRRTRSREARGHPAGLLIFVVVVGGVVAALLRGCG